MKKKKILSCLLIATSMLLTTSISANAEWRTNRFTGEEQYYGSDGYMVFNKWVYDMQNNKTYYIKGDGTRSIGLKKIGGNYYYFQKDGSLSKGTLKIGDKTYETNDGKILNADDTISDYVITHINSVSELETYLEENYSTLKTPIGTLELTYNIRENNSDVFGYDFSIQTNYGKIENDKYNLVVFQPYELEHSIKISDSDKEETIELLKNLQKNVASDVMKAFPNKKIEGGFYKGGYKYEHIRVGYYSTKFLSWKNYEKIDSHDFRTSTYNNTEVTGFYWNDDNDDYDFTN